MEPRLSPRLVILLALLCCGACARRVTLPPEQIQALNSRDWTISGEPGATAPHVSAPTPAPAKPAIAPTPKVVPIQGGLVAVMPIDAREAKTDHATIVALEESIRTVTGDLLTPRGFTVLTGETTLAVLQDNGIDASAACEASCALAAARELQAKLFVSMTLTTTEGEFVGFVRLFENATGKQLGAVQLSGATVKELRKAFETRAGDFFKRVLTTSP